MKEAAKSVYQTKSRQRQLVANIWAHDIAQRLKIRRKTMAKDAGLGEVDVGTYPSNGAVNLIDGGGFWKGLALATLAGGGLGIASGLFQMKPDTAPLVVDPSPAVVAPETQEWELEIMSVDGKPVVKGIRRVQGEAK